MNERIPPIETEVRFIEVDVKVVKARLSALGATDLGEDFLKETIFYDTALTWKKEQACFVRLRTTKRGTFLAYKQHVTPTVDGTTEVEVKTSNPEHTHLFLEKIGLVAFRTQEKNRHTFTLGEVTVDIDQWPTIPPYVELEGPSEAALKEAAATLNLDWSTADTHGATWVIENIYHIPVRTLHYFTFDRVE